MRDKRLEAGLSQQRLADRAGISVRALREIEQGRVRQPRGRSVVRLADALGLSDCERHVLQPGAQPPGGWGRSLHIGVLGSLTLRHGQRPMDLGANKQRSLLALLALQPGQVVSCEEITDVLWGAHAPKTAANLITVYVAALRRFLEPERPVGARPRILVRGRAGYQLLVEPRQLDAAQFHELVRCARQAAVDGRAKSAGDLLARALACWRGPVLCDLDTPLRQHPAAVDLANQRIEAALAFGDLALRVGNLQDALPELRRLSQHEPLHEGLHARLMIALAGVGQQAIALQMFEEIRARLDDELGVEPGPEIRAAQLRVLRQQLPTGGRDAGRSSGSAGSAGPAQLPADIVDFVGRNAQLRRLNDLLRHATSPATAVLILTIVGAPGVGKTALAVHWAQQIRDRFPDGQLYVDLCGFAPSPPVRPVEALARFLRALGVPADQVPNELDEAAAAYRTLLAGKRILVLLDNAAEPDQVRPLLPGSPGCLVLLTSRDHLAGLVAREAAGRLTLDTLTWREAGTLLARVLGVVRVRADREAATDLASLCDRLPLALRIAAELAAARPATALAALVQELADEHRRLDLLDAGADERTAVRAVFSWSYRHLPTRPARGFRLLGLHPGRDFTPDTLAALGGTDVGDARHTVEALVRSCLARETASGRYAVHDLLRVYAAEQAAGDSAADRRAALTGLFDYYFATAAAAMNTLFPADRHRRPLPPDGALISAVADPTAARAWLDAERPNLVAAARYGAAHGWLDHAQHLAATLWRYLARDHATDAHAIHGYALDAARQAGDSFGEATALHNLARVHEFTGRTEEAIDCYRRALLIRRRICDRDGAADSLNNLGNAYWRLGNYREADEKYQQALSLYRQLGDVVRQAGTLCNIGMIHERWGRYDNALDHLHQARTIFRAVGEHHSEASVTGCIGVIYERWGRHEEALAHHQEAYAIFDRTGDRFGQAEALAELGVVHRELARLTDAIECGQQALAIYRELGERRGEAETLEHLAVDYERSASLGQALDYHRLALAVARQVHDRDTEAFVLNGLGDTLRVTGQPSQARASYETALTIACDVGDRHEQARARDGLGRALDDLGEHDEAAIRWSEALALYTELNDPTAEAVRGRLADRGGAGVQERNAPAVAATPPAPCR